MKIVTVPNAFKGSLTATETAIAMEADIRKILPNAEVIQVPVADGEMVTKISLREIWSELIA